MISTELATAVLKRKIYWISEPYAYIPTIRLHFDTEQQPYYDINLHDLANQVKTWASTQNYWLDSGIQLKPKGWQANCGYLDLNSQIAKDFYADTEPDAVFKAGDYILQLEAGSDD